MTPRKPGRPPLHPDAARIRRLALVCTDDEWEMLRDELEPDASDRYVQIFFALTSSDGRWLRQRNELLRLAQRLVDALDEKDKLKSYANELLAKCDAVTGVTTQEDSDDD